jgi:hypothetical protein
MDCPERGLSLKFGFEWVAWSKQLLYLTKWLFLIAMMSPTYAQNGTNTTETTYLQCTGSLVTVPYCLQCTDVCLLECGGPDVRPPWCHACEDECVTPPGNPKFLGDDGMPFIVNMTELDAAKMESEGRKMSWAAEVKWNTPSTLSENQWLALCWGFKTGDCRAEMTYKCVNISP